MRVITGKKYIMKIKSIIWSTVAVMLLSACASEEIIDTPVQKSGSVTIRFASANTVTKATAEDPNTWATAEETTIENYTIAVFEGAILKDNCPCIKVVSGNTTSSTTTESETGSTTGQTVKAYSVSVTDLPINTPLSFLVIANSKTAGFPSYFTQGLTYKSFDDSELTYSFEASKLIKVGKKENVTFQPSSTPVEVKVPLIQLTARIDFAGVNYNAEGDNGENTTTTGGQWVDLTSTELEVLYKQYFDVNNLSEQKVELNEKVRSVAENRGGDYVLTGNYLSFNYDKSYYVGRLYIQKSVTTTTVTSPGAFSVKGTTVGNLNQKSDILIYNTSSIENKQDGLDVPPIDFEKTFYTYELLTKDRDITLNINGGLVSSEKVTTITKYQIQVQTRTKRGSYTDVRGKMPLSLLGSTTNTENTKQPDLLETYALSIPYKSIIKGHIYEVTGSLKPSISPTIEWQVEDLTSVTVDIPPFN